MTRYIRVIPVCFLLILIILHSFTGCFAENTSVLRITIPPDTTNSPALAALYEDRDFRERIEARIGAELVVSIDTVPNIPYTELRQSKLFDKSGIIFTSDLELLTQLSDQRMLYEFSMQDISSAVSDAFQTDQIAGRYKGRQFAVILPFLTENYHDVYFLAHADLMQKAVSDPVDADPETFRAILRVLKNEGIIPLAAYGSPSEDGFLPLLSLFDLAGMGNGDFLYEDGHIVFSKITPEAREYLAYTHDLYEEGLIPSDFLNIDQYSAMDMFLQKKCAMTLLTSPSVIEEIRSAGIGSEIQIVRIELPGAAGQTDPWFYHRIMAIYPADSVEIELKNDFLRALYEESLSLESPDYPEFPYYPLYSEESYCEQRTDPIPFTPYNLSIIADKLRNDETIIIPYYSKIVAGELPLESFSVMRNKWLVQGGEEALEIMDAYYSNYLLGISFGVYKK